MFLPLTVKLAVNVSFPATLAATQMYSPLSIGIELNNCNVLDDVQ